MPSRSQGSDSDWLLPAIHHIANIIGEKKKDKIKEYVKELCQDYPDIRCVKWQMPELLGSIPNSASSPRALAKLFNFSSLLVATRQRSRCWQQGESHLILIDGCILSVFNPVCWILQCTQVTAKASSF